MADAPISPEARQDILEAHTKGATAEELVEMIEKRLVEVAAKLESADPNSADELAKLESEYVQEVTAADQEFNAEMQAIEAEFKELESSLSKDLDNARLDELKEERQQIAG